MKKLIVLIALIFSVTTAFAQQDAEQQVLKAEREWLDAYEKNDTLQMSKLVAEGFVIRYASGTTETKADLLNMLKRNIASGRTSGSRFYTEQTTASVYAGTVILRGIVVSEFEMGGERKQVKQYYTDTWVQTAAGWQVVASHLTDVVPAKKQAGVRKVG